MTQKVDFRRRLVERYHNELWNQWQFDLIPALLSPNIVFGGSLGVDVNGHDGFLKYMQIVQSAFPDFDNTVEETIVDGPTAAVRLTYRGTHKSAPWGIPQTGRSVEYAGVATFRFEDDMIATGWMLGDTVSVWRQLGVTPPGSDR